MAADSQLDNYDVDKLETNYKTTKNTRRNSLIIGNLPQLEFRKSNESLKNSIAVSEMKIKKI
jgi:hypothetical protein